MGFQQGLSGLSMSSKALDAVGNNIANVGTVGFKAATAQFSDLYAASLGGATGSKAIGQGGNIMAVAQTFTQGNVTNTNNPLDIAINGNGFLRFQPSLNDQTAEYSRNGQLHLDKEGYLVNAQDRFLNAFPSVDGQTVDQSRSGPLQLSNAQLDPRATGFMNSLVPGTGGVVMGLNFDARDKRADMAPAGDIAADGWAPLESWDFASLNPNMYNYSTSATIYDQRGEPHIMTMYFVRQGVDDGNGAGVGGTTWKPHFVLDSKYEIAEFDTNGATPAGIDSTLDFNPNGQRKVTEADGSPAANGPVFTMNLATAQVYDADGNATTVDLTTDPLNLFPNTDSTSPNYLAGYEMNFDFSSSTQFGSTYDVNKLTQDGYGPGRLSGVAIDGDGNISARYSNGQTKLMGQVALTTFQNPNGLVPLGNNMWAESSASGQPLVGSPNSGSRGSIQSGSVEDANVDLTQELVNMITLQRTYQANAQTIKTQDSILQTLVNLR